MRLFGIVAATVLSLLALGVPVRGAPAEVPAKAPAAPAADEKIIIDVEESGSAGEADAMTLRRLMACRQGRLTMSSRDLHMIGLKVKRVIEGRLPEYDPARRPGVALVQVLTLDDAALAIDPIGESNQFRGQWTLHRLPGGALAVMDIKDTPLKKPAKDAATITAELEKGLKSGNPESQRVAIQDFEHTRCFTVVPAVIALVDSRDSVRITSPIPDRPSYVTTVGALALQALLRVTSVIRDDRRPAGQDRAAWAAWWQEVLKTDPAPKIDVVPGQTTALGTESIMDKVRLSPDGATAVFGVPHAAGPYKSIAGGIRWLPLDQPEKGSFVYTSTAYDAQCLAAAWGKDAVGLVWHEGWYEGQGHPLKFLAVGLDGKPKGEPVDLPLMGVHQLGIAPAPDGWVVASNNRQGDLLVQRLSPTGQPMGKPLSLSPGAPVNSWNIDLDLLSIARTPTGWAVLRFTDKEGVFMDLIGDPLKVVQSIRVDEPPSKASPPLCQVCAGAAGLCAVWKAANDHLVARLYGFDGKPQTGPIEVTAHGAMGFAVTVGDGGFLLAWHDQGLAPNQLYAAWLAKEGKLGPRLTLANDREGQWPAAVVLTPTALRLVHINRDEWPFRILMKEVPRAALKKE